MLEVEASGEGALNGRIRRDIAEISILEIPSTGLPLGVDAAQLGVRRHDQGYEVRLILGVVNVLCMSAIYVVISELQRPPNSQSRSTSVTRYKGVNTSCAVYLVELGYRAGERKSAPANLVCVTTLRSWLAQHGPLKSGSFPPTFQDYMRGAGKARRVSLLCRHALGRTSPSTLITCTKIATGTSRRTFYFMEISDLDSQLDVYVAPSFPMVATTESSDLSGLAVSPQPENLALYRASTANREILNEFYTKLENLAESLQVTHLPGRFWNFNETGLTCVLKPNKVSDHRHTSNPLMIETPHTSPFFQLPQTNQERVTPKRDPKAKMISPTSQDGPSSAPDVTSYNPTPDATISHQKVLHLKQTRPSKSKQINIKKGKYKEGWFCGSCGKSHNEDVVEKMVLNGFSVIFVVIGITVHAKIAPDNQTSPGNDHHSASKRYCTTQLVEDEMLGSVDRIIILLFRYFMITVVILIINAVFIIIFNSLDTVCVECTLARLLHEIDELQFKQSLAENMDDDHATPTKKSIIDIENETGVEGDHEDSLDDDNYNSDLIVSYEKDDDLVYVLMHFTKEFPSTSGVNKKEGVKNACYIFSEDPNERVDMTDSDIWSLCKTMEISRALTRYRLSLFCEELAIFLCEDIRTGIRIRRHFGVVNGVVGWEGDEL
ncbi:hypothetical protein PR048_021156 [Dryococelus australis]|uniref:Uncharacterized protein n=1 Tax=Dryococelus australis TaxID=614101 RepID=A0ABQ9GXF7_9NEOP|nr:hypothetical protein PR048_021156 [Dryococelus australis]